MTIAGRVRRCCPWHLVDLAEAAEGDGVACLGHRPRAWLVVDALDRIVAAGSEAEPVSLLVHPPMPLADFIAGPWLRLRAPRATFGIGAAVARVPAAVRRAIAGRRKSAESLDARSESLPPCAR